MSCPILEHLSKSNIFGLLRSFSWNFVPRWQSVNGKHPRVLWAAVVAIVRRTRLPAERGKKTLLSGIGGKRPFWVRPRVDLVGSSPASTTEM